MDGEREIAGQRCVESRDEAELEAQRRGLIEVILAREGNVQHLLGLETRIGEKELPVSRGRFVALRSLGRNQPVRRRSQVLARAQREHFLVTVAEQSDGQMLSQPGQCGGGVRKGRPAELSRGEGAGFPIAQRDAQSLLTGLAQRERQDLGVGQPGAALESLLGELPGVHQHLDRLCVIAQARKLPQHALLAEAPVDQRAEAVKGHGADLPEHLVILGRDLRSPVTERRVIRTPALVQQNRMPEAPAVLTECLSVRLGSTQVLDGVDLRVDPGDLYGLLGRNGAGKTTSMRAFLGLLPHARGRCEIFGQSSARLHHCPEAIAVALDPPGLDDTLTVRQNLELARIRGGIEGGRSVDDALELVGLAHRAHHRGDRLSHGQGRRAAVARALLGDPRLLILDEPLSGLDPEGVEVLIELFRRLTTEDGVTVVLSSHHLREVEAVCTRVGMIEGARRSWRAK